MDLGGHGAGHHTDMRFIGHRQGSGGASAVGSGLDGDTMGSEEGFGLGDQDRMGAHMTDVRKRCTGAAHQADFDADKGFVDDGEPRLRQQGMDVGHPAIGRIFDGQHGQVRHAPLDGVNRVFEGSAGQSLHIGTGFETGFVAIGTWLALERNASGHVEFALLWASLGVWSRFLYLASAQWKP